MRLIDRDKLQRTEGIFTYRFTDDLDIMSCCAYRYEDVETAPTVKAIPIEYIQKWNNNYIADTMRNGRTIINQMLEDWEKENEQAN